MSRKLLKIILNAILIEIMSGSTIDGFVNRVDAGPDGSFSKTIDKFGNPYHVTDFCHQKNATCSNVNNCKECGCKAGDTFVSYRDGCMDLQSSINRIQGDL